MLVLSRKESESIAIGDHIRVRIVAIDGQTVRIGIEAPPEVRILRSELEQQNRVCVASESVEAPRVSCCATC